MIADHLIKQDLQKNGDNNSIHKAYKFTFIRLCWSRPRARSVRLQRINAP